MSKQNTKASHITITNHKVNIDPKLNNELLEKEAPKINKRLYRYTKKPRKQLAPRTWRTRPDPFENVLSKLRVQLVLNPARTAKGLLEDLIKDSPDKFNLGNLRTLQRKISQWRKEEIKMNQEKYAQNSNTEKNAISKYISLVANSITRG